MNESNTNSTYNSTDSEARWNTDSLPGNWFQSPSLRRWAPIISGATLAAIGISRAISRNSSFAYPLMAAGAALAYLGASTKEQETETVARGSVLLNCSPEEAYGRYRNFEEFPSFMHHLESVTRIGDRQYRWIARGPLDIPIQWDAEITDEQTGQFIAWHSLPRSPIMLEGSVRFETAPANRGTFLTAVTRIQPPAGNLGRAVARLFGKDPSFLMQQDLRRFKALIETGEIPTTDGQTSGRRSAVDEALRTVNPDRPKRREPATSETFNKNWRTA